MRGYKIWLPLASLFLFFLIAEIICRVVGSKEKVDTGFKFYVRNLDNDVEYAFMREDHFLLWSPEPNYDDGEISINSDGFRDKEYKAEKARNTFRILCLGDSSTFGFGITSLSHTYHELLEDELNHQYGKNVIYEVINAGVTGYTSYQGLNLFKYKGAKYDPDIVTFYFGINDPIKRFYLNDAQIVNNKVPSTMKIMNNNFMLKFASYRFLHNIISKLMDIVLHTNVPRVPVEDYKENIRKLNQLCKKNGAKFLLISPPLRKEGISRYTRAKDIVLYRKALERVANEYQIPLIKIGELTEESPVSTEAFFTDQLHPNDLGHAMIMNRLHDFLVSRDLVPR